MICPKCAGETELAVYDEVKVDRCQGCGGLWFDSGELAELRQDTWMADYVLDTGDAKVGKRFNRVDHIKCPQCGSLMNEEFDADQPHIMYEQCPEGHGTFLDAGEFTDLVHKTFWDRFKRLA
ncbi:MAG: zf-TFIIB domain-containing protein [Xanthomonadales bacterium]|nr:zf-TFIIB domain-containing protein [Xanthomonadales bacterium]